MTTPAPTTRESTRQSMWMLVAGLLFASMGVCVKLGGERFSAGELVFYRSFISLLVVWGFMRAKGWTVRTPLVRLQVQRGLSGFVSLLMYFYAITVLPLPTAVTLNYTSPLWLAVWLVVLERRRLQPWLAGAIVAGFVGAVMLLQPTLAHGHVLGATLGMISGATAGHAILGVRRLGEAGEPEWRTVFWFSAISSAGSLPWAAAGVVHAIDLTGAMLLLGTGVLGALAQLAMTRAYRHGKALLSASLSYSAVVFSSLYGMLLWHDTLPLLAWGGMALIVASGLVASTRSRAAPAEQD